LSLVDFEASLHVTAPLGEFAKDELLSQAGTILSAVPIAKFHCNRNR
jgi:hypothetical protein